MGSTLLSKLTTINKKTNTSPRVRRSRIQSNKSTTSTPQNNGILYTIGTPLEEVNESLKKLIKNNKEEDKRKREQAKKEKNEDREKKLEKPKGLGIKLPSITNPFNKINFNFFDKIGNFLLFTFLGWLFNNFSLGGASPLVRKIGSILTASFFEVINNTFMFLLDTFVFFVDQGYKLHDTISGLIKRVKGEDGAPESQNIFNKFTDQLGYFGTLFALSGATMLAVMGGTKLLANSILDEKDTPDPNKRDPNKPNSKKPDSKTPKAPKGKLTKAKQLARISTKKIGRGVILKAVRPALRRMAVIGAFLDFGISVALGEPLGRAAFSLIGAGLLGTIGAGLGGPVGAILGGLAGDYIGAKLYDVFFTGKKNVGPKETQGARSGGTVAKTNKKRRIVRSRAPKRTIKAKHQDIKRPVIRNERSAPGKNVGGPREITKLFKDPENSHTFSDVIDRVSGRKKPNPFGALTKIAGIMRDIPFGIGSLMSSTVDMVLGQMPSKNIYENISNSIMYIVSAFSADNTRQLLSRISTFSMGGEIPPERSLSIDSGLMDSKQLSGVLQRSISKKMKEALNVVKMEISKSDYERGGENPGGSGDGFDGDGQFIEDIKGVTGGERELLLRLMIAEASGQGDVGLALVARSVLNRSALIKAGKITAGEYLSNSSSLTDIINGSGQYQPVREGKLKRTLTESEYAKANSALILALNTDQLKTKLKSEGYNESQIRNLLAVTGFRTPSAGGDSSQNVNTIRHKGHIFNTAGNRAMLVPGMPQVSIGGHLNGATLAYKGGATITQSNDPDNQHSGMDVALLDSSGGFNNGAKIPNPVDKLTITKADGWNWNGTRGFGHYITGTFIGKDGKKYELLIGHLHKKSNLRVGQVLTRGQIIGLQGMSGSASGPHATTHVNSLDKGGDPWKVLRNEVVKPWQTGWKAENPTRLAMKNGVEGIIVKENGKDVWKPKVWTAEDKENHRKQQDKNKPPQLGRSAAAAPTSRATNTASPIITPQMAGDLDKKIKSAKPGSGEKVRIPGVGTFVAGRNILGLPEDKYFDMQGRQIDKNDFLKRAQEVMRIQQTQTRGGVSSLQPQINSNNISKFASYNEPTQTANVFIQPVIINKPSQQIAKTMGYPFIASGSSSVPEMNLDLGRA